MSGMTIVALTGMGGVTFGVLADTVVRAVLSVRPAREASREPLFVRAEVDRLTAAAFEAGQAQAVLGDARNLMADRARLRAVDAPAPNVLEGRWTR